MTSAVFGTSRKICLAFTYFVIVVAVEFLIVVVVVVAFSLTWFER